MIGFDVLCSVTVPKSNDVNPNFSNADLEGISRFLKDIDWAELFQGQGAVDSWDCFLGKINCYEVICSLEKA